MQTWAYTDKLSVGDGPLSKVNMIAKISDHPFPKPWDTACLCQIILLLSHEILSVAIRSFFPQASRYRVFPSGHPSPKPWDTEHCQELGTWNRPLGISASQRNLLGSFHSGSSPLCFNTGTVWSHLLNFFLISSKECILLHCETYIGLLHNLSIFNKNWFFAQNIWNYLEKHQNIVGWRSLACYSFFLQWYVSSAHYFVHIGRGGRKIFLILIFMIWFLIGLHFSYHSAKHFKSNEAQLNKTLP